MEYIKEAVLGRVGTKELAAIIILGGVASFLPFFIHLQWITGPVINAILIIVLFLSGLRAAIVVSAVPSLMALAGGLLPVFLAPAVPFIILGNILFVAVIGYLYYHSNKSDAYWRSTFVGALVKFTLLFISAKFLVFFIQNSKAAVVLATMLGVNQLFTALAGSIIAFLILKMLKRI